MTEVEKKAIENIKEMIELHDDNCLITTDDDFECLKVLLCLIEKQQKEIEDLKMQNHIIRDMNLTVRLSEEVFDETYIRKDKIKELREIDNIDLIQFKLKELLGGYK